MTTISYCNRGFINHNGLANSLLDKIYSISFISLLFLRSKLSTNGKLSFFHTQNIKSAEHRIRCKINQSISHIHNILHVIGVKCSIYSYICLELWSHELISRILWSKCSDVLLSNIMNTTTFKQHLATTRPTSKTTRLWLRHIYIKYKSISIIANSKLWSIVKRFLTIFSCLRGLII